MNSDLVSVCVFERDAADLTRTWTYPSIDKPTDAVLRARCGLRTTKHEGHVGSTSSSLFCRFKNTWQYIVTEESNSNSQASLPKTQAFSLCLITKQYHPEKYLALAKCMADSYSLSGSPLSILERFLAASTSGRYGNDWEDAAFNPSLALIASPILEVVDLLGEDSVHLWTALMLKKRILVYCDDLSEVQKIVRAIPCLAWHRQNWDILRPYIVLSQDADEAEREDSRESVVSRALVSSVEAETNDLKEAGAYIAGCTDASIAAREDELWDVLVNVSSRSVKIAESVKEDFQMTKIQREISAILLNREEPIKNQALIKAVALKTRETIQKLASLRAPEEEGQPERAITQEVIQSLGVPAPLGKLLLHIALAENLCN